MNLVILDGHAENPGDLSWDGIRAFGRLTVHDRTPHDNKTIIDRIKDADIVITNKTPLDRHVIDACPKLSYITMLATGYDMVDVGHAREKDIPVSNIPAYGTASVAQFAFALLLEICHHVGHHDHAVHHGAWQTAPDFCFWDEPLIELAGKTMGIIGFGRIGQAVAKIATSFGMHVIAHDPHPTEAGKTLAAHVTLNDLYASSDVISLHCPLTDDNAGMIDKTSIAKMKPGVILINNARGGLIHERDLADALNEERVYAAGLDVVSSEPIEADNPLPEAKNCIITPHISWASKASRKRIMKTTEDNIRAFMDGDPIHVVN